MVTFTPEAVEVIARAHDAATRLNPGVSLRLSLRGGALDASLTEGPLDGDVTIAAGDREVVVAPDLEGIVDVEPPHDRLVLRAAPV